ncbi:hypothetical protein C8Q80DRAFT_358321 [Daedaleopsis nitida]|nr:hypothetical protein C8Q80DRAFT_358321 [Daedaleopsis nitida]
MSLPMALRVLEIDSATLLLLFLHRGRPSVPYWPAIRCTKNGDDDRLFSSLRHRDPLQMTASSTTCFSCISPAGRQLVLAAKEVSLSYVMLWKLLSGQ